MPYCYVIYSPRLDSYYIGSCRDFDLRLEAHRSKKYAQSYTRKSDDWECYLRIETLTIEHALRLERKIKRMKSRHYIEHLKRYPELIEKILSETSA